MFFSTARQAFNVFSWIVERHYGKTAVATKKLEGATIVKFRDLSYQNQTLQPSD
jgi:hypothetical protein